MTGDRPTRAARHGILYALAAFGTWGLIAPIHFKLLAAVPAVEILAHRVVWASVLALMLVAVARRGRELAAVVTGRRVAPLCLSALLVGGNWLLYIWSVNAGHMVQTSLGYFINPLVNVALGILFLGERLRPLQLAACLLAGMGVAVLTAASGEMPWIALALAVSFGFYGLIRKTTPVDPLIGFSVESLLLLPLALGYLVLIAGGAFLAIDRRVDLLLVLTGLTTAAPLIWFAAAARRLKLSTVGLMQYLAPSCQLALAVLVYGEAFTTAHAIAFAAIWTALAVYSFDALRPGFGRHPRVRTAAVED